jgi:hypothetical protein
MVTGTMAMGDMDVRALAAFENEGGRVREASPVKRRRDEVHTSRHPVAPGCTAQPAWGFRDPTGRVFYWFFHVYGPKGAGKLNSGSSFWSATWQSTNDAGKERTHVRSMTHHEARRLHPRLSFERFSSQEHMRERLPALLNVDIGTPPW